MDLHQLFRSSRLAVTSFGSTRGNRMSVFSNLLGLRPGLKILDLGGRPEIWASIQHTLDITFLNLPGETGMDVPTHHRATFVEGDACNVAEYASGTFDLVFSNSVIEHVGDLDRQRAFANEARRLGRGYWIQTPSKWFPLEPHTGMPFWWFYPPEMREFFFARWRRALPGWTRSMQETRVLTVDTLRDLFPDGSLWIERLASIPKSYALYRPMA